MRQHKTGKLTRMACGASGVIVAPWQGRAIQSDFSLSPIYQATWHSNAQTQQISRCKLRAIVLPTGDSNERLTWRYITGELRINRHVFKQAFQTNVGFKQAFHLILRHIRNKLFKRSIQTGDAFSCCYRDAVAVGGAGLEPVVE